MHVGFPAFELKNAAFSYEEIFHQAHTFLCLVLTFVLIFFFFIYLWKMSMFRSYKERRLLNCLLSVQYFIAGLKSDYGSLRA